MRPLRRELSKTLQKLGGDLLGQHLKYVLKHPWLLQTPGSVCCPPHNPRLSKSEHSPALGNKTLCRGLHGQTRGELWSGQAGALAAQ